MSLHNGSLHPWQYTLLWNLVLHRFSHVTFSVFFFNWCWVSSFFTLLFLTHFCFYISSRYFSDLFRYNQLTKLCKLKVSIMILRYFGVGKTFKIPRLSNFLIHNTVLIMSQCWILDPFNLFYFWKFSPLTNIKCLPCFWAKLMICLIIGMLKDLIYCNY